MDTTTVGDYRLSAYYLNTRRISVLSGISIPVDAQQTLTKNSASRAAAMCRAEDIADRLLRSGRIPDLSRLANKGLAEANPVYAALWEVYTFKGVSKNLHASAAGKTSSPASFRGSVTLNGEELEIVGKLSNEHLYSDTSATILSGKRRMLLCARFERRENCIEAHPIIIGDLVDADDSMFGQSLKSLVRVYPEQIDAFAAIRDQDRANAAAIRALKEMSEEKVKNAIAAIIGEPFIPKDWGGEKSDLQTNQLSVGGKPCSAAFIFKGPAVRGELHPGKMGKNGDQLVRAFDEPVEVVIVQHCDKIANSVVRLAEALAYDPRQPRRYCILDGADTARLLMAYGYLRV